MSSILRVGNLPATVTERDLTKHFSRYGSVSRLTIARDSVTGASRRFADIEMADDAGALASVKWLHLSQFDGRTITVMLINASHAVI